MNRTVYRSGGVVVRSVRREVQRRFNSYKTGQLLLSSPFSLPPFSLSVLQADVQIGSPQ